MLREDFLLDTFSASGEKADDFEVCVRAIDKHTEHYKRCLKNFVVVSLKDEAQDNPDIMKAWYLDPANPCNNGKLKPCSVPKDIKLRNVNMQPVIQETLDRNPTLLIDRETNSIYFLSDAATNTLAQRIGVSGESLRSHSLERDLFIARKMNVCVDTTIIVKQYLQVGKIFAMMSGNYVHIPLYELCIIYKDFAGESQLGRMDCEGWNITHEKAVISFAFPDYAKEISAIYNLKREMIPCVKLATSDTGECSFIIRGYWKTSSGAIVYDHTFSRRHRGEIDTDEIEKEVQKQIFDRYNQLPERLVELMALDITPPGLNLHGARGSGKNRKAVCDAFKFIFRQLDIAKIIGKGQEMALRDAIDFNIVDGEMHYTAYDVVMDVFDLAETMKSYFESSGVCLETVRKFQEAVSKAAYVDFTKMKKEPREVYLTS